MKTDPDSFAREARETRRYNIRQRRQRAMAKLDAEAWRILEAVVPELADVARRKQALRDLPADPRIDQAPNSTGLYDVWHRDLGPRPDR